MMITDQVVAERDATHGRMVEVGDVVEIGAVQM
jgi:hypothetical protein